MDSETQRVILHRCGVPLGAPRIDHDFPSDEQIVDSLVNLAELDEHERDAVWAWLDAFEHHWPERFGNMALQTPEGTPADWGRHIKLRRIAIANLARAL